MRSFASRLQLLVAAVPLLAASCGGAGTPPNPAANGSSHLLSRAQTGPHLGEPALIAIDELSGDLVYWEIKDGPSGTPITLTGNLGTYNANAMVSNGDVVIIASHAPPEIIEYNIKTKGRNDCGGSVRRAEPRRGRQGRYGLRTQPARDRRLSNRIRRSHLRSAARSCAARRHSRLPSTTRATSSLPPARLARPTSSSCPPAHAGDCVKLDLKKPSNLGGIGIDPKTDDLIVVDNPGILCSYVGRLTIYPKPYASGTAKRHTFYAKLLRRRFSFRCTLDTHLHLRRDGRRELPAHRRAIVSIRERHRILRRL